MNKHLNAANSFNRQQHDLAEYLLLANPSKDVYEKVMVEKERFYEHFGVEIAIKTYPHITIANFVIKEREEDLLCRGVQNVCNLQRSFKAGLKDFNGFESKAIYICVQNHEPFQKLARSLRNLDDVIDVDPRYPTILVTKPHMTIARGLNTETYQRAFAEYAQMRFQDEFTVEKLTLIKRCMGSPNWQHVTHFYLPAERTLFN